MTPEGILPSQLPLSEIFRTTDIVTEAGTPLRGVKADDAHVMEGDPYAAWGGGSDGQIDSRAAAVINIPETQAVVAQMPVVLANIDTITAAYSTSPRYAAGTLGYLYDCANAVFAIAPFLVRHYDAEPAVSRVLPLAQAFTNKAAIGITFIGSVLFAHGSQMGQQIKPDQFYAFVDKLGVLVGRHTQMVAGEQHRIACVATAPQFQRIVSALLGQTGDRRVESTISGETVDKALALGSIYGQIMEINARLFWAEVAQGMDSSWSQADFGRLIAANPRLLPDFMRQDLDRLQRQANTILGRGADRDCGFGATDYRGFTFLRQPYYFEDSHSGKPVDVDRLMVELGFAVGPEALPGQ